MSSAPATATESARNLFDKWKAMVDQINELLQCEPDSKEDDPDMRSDIKKWSKDVKDASGIFFELMDQMRTVGLPMGISDNMAKSIQDAVGWGERLRAEDKEEEEMKSGRLNPATDAPNGTVTVPAATPQGPGEHAKSIEVVDPASNAPEKVPAIAEQDQNTPRRSARQDAKAAAAADAAQPQATLEEGDTKSKGEQPSVGWFLYDSSGTHIGVLSRDDIAQYHKPCVTCVAKRRTECTGKAGYACVACRKSGSKCNYAFHGKADIRSPPITQGNPRKRKGPEPSTAPIPPRIAQANEEVPSASDRGTKRARSSGGIPSSPCAAVAAVRQNSAGQSVPTNARAHSAAAPVTNRDALARKAAAARIGAGSFGPGTFGAGRSHALVPKPSMVDRRYQTPARDSAMPGIPTVGEDRPSTLAKDRAVDEHRDIGTSPGAQPDEVVVKVRAGPGERVLQLEARLDEEIMRAAGQRDMVRALMKHVADLSQEIETLRGVIKAWRADK
ncbi:hypothetical protein BOTBODRAFT_181854 [Botryobasidium botryosum FD-172 SS1]|uniref:Zn(2)-C6 fungal-type domain-containing protein n=1 Tax=Botryobasidium botryosum (strain FD-172 SS1) TaxID=930990 RepID=A0A067LSV6_BOTB1|nr:hypothetical protein BOTBODRAFT_181854 [Botryobasidium botryosum FD-172 SS1]